MSVGSLDFEIDLDFVRSVTERAAEMALELCRGVVCELKPDRTYVTDVDRQIERFLEAELLGRFPEHSFLGEEYGLRGSLDTPLWAVDPIDGTTNMVLGAPLWAVSVGLVVNNAAVAGVIAIPRTGEVFWAQTGHGAFLNGSRIEARDPESPDAEDPLGMTTRGAKQYDLITWPGVIRLLGTIAGELVYVAKGSMVALVGHSRTLHDVAAGFCIASEAGCEVLHMDGSPIDLMAVHADGGTRSPFVVAPPRMRRWLTANLAERY